MVATCQRIPAMLVMTSLQDLGLCRLTHRKHNFSMAQPFCTVTPY